MCRPRSAAVLVASLCLGFSASSLIAGPPVADRARTLLSRDDAKGAIFVLEDAIPVAPDDRAAVLELLRQAYTLAAKQADAAGDARAAELYRDNLAILNRKPTASPAQSRRGPTDAAVTQTAAPEARPAPAEARPAPAPAPDAVVDALPLRTASMAPAGSDSAPASAAPASASAAATAAPAVSIAAADAAFVKKDYAAAGRLYGVLDQEKRLPASRRDHWAYCRCAEVVRRINARPATPAEWDSIDVEIQQIRSLSPNNWYAEYLRNLASERNAGRRARPSQKVVVRGSAPEEALAPPPPAATPADAQPATLGNWQVRETANFRILHADAALADRVAEVAEAARDAQVKRWSGPSVRGPWSPRCDIYVYPSAKVFSRMTGQPEESPGFSTMGMNAGRIIARRVNIRADHANVLQAVLPHEITHVVLADLFPTQQIPRWADEGIAVLSEPPSEQRLRASDLSAPLTSGRLFKLSDLMVMDYPDGKFWGLYYAQSVSVTRFLVEQGSPAQFVKFVQGAQRNGTEAELRRVYGIDGFDDLHKRWLAYARMKADGSSVAANSTPAAETANRE